MLTSILLDAARKNNLIIVDGGICRFSRKKDGSIKILDLLSIQPGAGQEILSRLKALNPTRLIAACPTDWEANSWYRRNGFIYLSETMSPNGKNLNNYELRLEEGLF